MRIDNNKGLEPKENKNSQLAANTNRILEGFQRQISNLGEQLSQLQEALTNIATELQTGSVNASTSVSSPTGTFDNASVNNTLSAGAVNTSELDSDHASIDSLSAMSATVMEVDADSVKSDSAEIIDLKARNLDVDNLEIAAAKITQLESNKIKADTVETDRSKAKSIETKDLSVTGDTQFQDANFNNARGKNLSVSNTIIGKNIAGVEADFRDLQVKTEKAVAVLHDKLTDSFLTIDEDVYIKVAGKTTGEILLRLEDGDGVTVMTARVNLNQITRGKENGKIYLCNDAAVSNLFIDVSGNLWIQLVSGVRGKLYYFISGMETEIPKTYSQENTPFDTSTAKSYAVQTLPNFSLILDGKQVFVSAPKTVIDGDLEVNGYISISGFESERAMYLGTSDFVTADENGNLSANSISSVGDAAIGGDATVTGSLNVEDGITGNLTGNVTGDVTGNLTGNVTGNVDGTATNAINDGDGNEITETYATKAEIENMMTTDTEQKITAEKDFSKSPVISDLLDDTPVDAGENVVCFDENGKLVAGKIVSNDPYSGFFKVTNLDEFKAALESAESKPILIMNSFSWSYTQGQTVAAGRASVSIYDISYFDKSKTQSPIVGSLVFITGLSTLYLYGVRMTGIGFATSGVGNTSVTLYSAYFSSSKFYRIYNAVDSTIEMDSSDDSVSNKIILNAVDCTITAQIIQSTSDPGLKIYRMKGGTLNIKWKYSYSSAFDADYGYTEVVENLENVTVNVTADSYARYAKIPYYFYCRESAEAFINCNFTFTFSDISVYFPGALFKFGSQMSTFSGPRKYFHGNKVNIVLSAVPSYWTKAYCNMFEFEGLEPICFFGNEIKVNGYWNASSLYKLCVFGVTTATGTNDYSNWLSDIYDNDFFLNNSYNTSNSNYQPSFINYGNGHNFILANCRDNRYHFPSYAKARGDIMYNSLAGGNSPLQSPQLTVGDKNTTVPSPGSNDAFLFGNEILAS